MIQVSFFQPPQQWRGSIPSLQASACRNKVKQGCLKLGWQTAKQNHKWFCTPHKVKTPQTRHSYRFKQWSQITWEGEGWNITHSSQRVVKSLAVAADTLIPLSVTSKYRPGSSTNPGTTVTVPQEQEYFRSSPEPQFNFLTLKYPLLIFPIVHLFPITHPPRLARQSQAPRLESSCQWELNKQRCCPLFSHQPEPYEEPPL